MTLQEAYKVMLLELQSSRLEVILVPANEERDGRCIRVPVSQNVEWYQQLCRDYPRLNDCNLRRKKPRTRIRRQNIESVLGRLAKNKKSCSKYVSYLRDVAETYLEQFDLSEDELRWFLEYGDLPEPFTGQF